MKIATLALPFIIQSTISFGYLNSNYNNREDHPAKCIVPYEIGIKRMEQASIRRLKPGTYTKEKIAEARSIDSGIAIAIIDGVLIETVLSPFMILLSPWVVQKINEEKKLKKMRDLLDEVYNSDKSQKMSAYFLKKIKKRHQDNNTIQTLTSADFVKHVINLDKKMSLCPLPNDKEPWYLGEHFASYYRQTVSMNDFITNFPHMINKVDP